MSQSATLYRITKESFHQLEDSEVPGNHTIDSIAKSLTTFEGSFLGLAYILSKGENSQAQELIDEIFNPKRAIGEEIFNGLEPEDQFEFYAAGKYIPYLDITTINKLNQLLEKITEKVIHLKYDSKELNANGIYPEVWHDNNSPDQAYNELHLQEDFKALKTIIWEATKDQDYILVFVG